MGASDTAVTTRPDGVSATRARDAFGGVKTVSYFDGTPQVTNRFNKVGLVTQVKSPASTVTHTHDSLGQTTQTIHNGRKISYAYNVPGRVSSLTYPNKGLSKCGYPSGWADALGSFVGCGSKGGHEVAGAADSATKTIRHTPGICPSYVDLECEHYAAKHPWVMNDISNGFGAIVASTSILVADGNFRAAPFAVIIGSVAVQASAKQANIDYNSSLASARARCSDDGAKTAVSTFSVFPSRARSAMAAQVLMDLVKTESGSCQSMFLLALVLGILGALFILQSFGLRSDWRKESAAPETQQWGYGTIGSHRLNNALGNIATGRVRYWGPYWWAFTIGGVILILVAVAIVLA